MKKLTIASLSVVLALVACGGGSTGGGPATPSANVSVPPGCTDLSSSTGFTLTMKNIAFHPSCLVVKASQTITLSNRDGKLHNFTAPGTNYDLDIQPHTDIHGEAVGIDPGTYKFFCKYHKAQGMTGTIVVT